MNLGSGMSWPKALRFISRRRNASASCPPPMILCPVVGSSSKERDGARRPSVFAEPWIASKPERPPAEQADCFDCTSELLWCSGGKSELPKKGRSFALIHTFYRAPAPDATPPHSLHSRTTAHYEHFSITSRTRCPISISCPFCLLCLKRSCL